MVYEANPDRLEFAPAQLITNLVKAIQELSAKNTALEAEIAALKTKDDALEARITALENA